ncbi:hypothetical protein JCM1840_004843 [Sporobolomyces johnsonii]
MSRRGGFDPLPPRSPSAQPDPSYGRQRTMHSHEHRPDSPSLSGRIPVLSDRLDRAKEVLHRDCSSGDRFSLLALSMLEKNIEDLAATVLLIEQTRDAGSAPSAKERPALLKIATEDAELYGRRRDDPPTSNPSSLSKASRSREARPPESDPSKTTNADRTSSPPPSQPSPLFKSSRSRDTSPNEPERHKTTHHARSPFPHAPGNRLRSSSMKRTHTPQYDRIARPPSAAPDSYEHSSSPRRPAVPLTSSLPPLSPTQQPLPPSRPPSRPASRFERPTDENELEQAPDQTTRQSLSRLFKRKPDAASPLAAPSSHEYVPPISSSLPATASDEGLVPRRENLDVKTASNSSRRLDVDTHSSSSRRHRHVASITSDSSTNSHAAPSRDEGSEGRSKTRSFGGGASRVRHGRSEEARRALDMASAPPSDDPEERIKASVNLPPALSGERVVKAIAFAAANDKALLLSLARMSKGYNKVVTPLLYSTVTVSNLPQLEKLNTSLDSNPSLGSFVTSLTITPLDASIPVSSAGDLVPPLRRLVSRLPNLTALDEDFTITEWDVRTLSGEDYPLAVSSPSKQLARLRSAQCWWEIGALHQLLLSQPQLQELVLGGAAMDRDWDGVKLKASLSAQPASQAPARNLTSLEIAQVMHEDTLAVLLLATGGSSSSQLRTLRIGFQSIGASDDDTPRASIPAALELVGSALTHLALSAPRKGGSDDTAGLLDECLAVLPSLEILEFSESTELLPAPLGSSQTLKLLPKTLKILRARGLVSVSTSRVLNMLDDPDSIPVLEELDVVWAKGTGGGEDGKEPWWKERHIKKIEEACEEYGIRCRVGKGDEGLVGV